jgi:hypothetical protein
MPSASGAIGMGRAYSGDIGKKQETGMKAIGR